MRSGPSVAAIAYGWLMYPGVHVRWLDRDLLKRRAKVFCVSIAKTRRGAVSCCSVLVVISEISGFSGDAFSSSGPRTCAIVRIDSGEGCNQTASSYPLEILYLSALKVGFHTSECSLAAVVST